MLLNNGPCCLISTWVQLLPIKLAWWYLIPYFHVFYMLSFTSNICETNLSVELLLFSDIASLVNVKLLLKYIGL